MYYRNRKPPYQKYVLYTAVIVIAVALVIFGGKALKSELDEAKAAALTSGRTTNTSFRD